MYWVFVITAVLILGMAEILLANFNIVLPLLLCAAFYLTAVAGWRRVIIPLVAVSSIADAVWIHFIPFQTVEIVLVIVLASRWRNWGDIYSILSLAMMGFVIGIISASVMLFEIWLAGARPPAGYSARLAICFFGSIVLLPMLCRILDYLAEVFDLSTLNRRHAAVLKNGDDEASYGGANED